MTSVVASGNVSSRTNETIEAADVLEVARNTASCNSDSNESDCELPFVSVIIPVYNDLERVTQCLEALEHQTYPSDRYEVIVVDNGSREPIAQHIGRFRHAVAEFEPRAGSYAARNRGIEAAGGDVLAFTDADCVPSAQWLQAGVAALQTSATVLAGGRIEVTAQQSRRPSAVELYEMLYAFPQDINVRAGFSVTANLFACRPVFDRVGGFDAGLRSGGDRDWVARAVAAGNGLVYSDAALVRHPARQSLRQIGQRSARFAGGDFDRSHRGSLQLRRARIETLLKLKPPISVVRRVLLGADQGSLLTRLSVLGVAYFSNLSYAAEWLRLELGGRARR